MTLDAERIPVGEFGGRAPDKNGAVTHCSYHETVQLGPRNGINKLELPTKVSKNAAAPRGIGLCGGEIALSEVGNRSLKRRSLNHLPYRFHLFKSHRFEGPATGDDALLELSEPAREFVIRMTQRRFRLDPELA